MEVLVMVFRKALCIGTEEMKLEARDSERGDKSIRPRAHGLIWARL